MSKTLWKPAALAAPVPPALITCGTVEKPNILTVAWTGILNSRPPITYISLRPERFSSPIIKDAGEFVINLPTAALVKAIDYCGVKSGRDTDKFNAMHLTPEPAKEVSAPLLAESPLSIECRIREVLPLGSHEMMLADIVAVQVDDSLLDDNGKLHLDRAGLAAYAHGEYFALGKKIGSFGFSVRKKRTKKPYKKR